MMTTVLLFFHFFFLHPLHLSVSEIFHNPETESLEITQRLFVDDLEEALRHFSKRRIDVLNPQSPEAFAEVLQQYLDHNFQLQLNGKAIKPSYIGYEIENDALWVYLEVPKVRKLKEIAVQNTIFFEMFDDQTNLINVDKGGKIRSLKLTEGEKKGQLKY